MSARAALVAALLALPARAADKPTVTVGSKTFTESYILAEIVAQSLEATGEAVVIRKFGLGGTGFLYRALAGGDIDIYPEYTGTISETVLKDSSVRDLAGLRAGLAPAGIVVGEPLGFNNTYALAARPDAAARLGLTSLGDLARAPALKAGFTHEFMRRPDGYPGLARSYSLALTDIREVEHSLAYEAMRRGELDITDVYSTDAMLERLNLTVLKDDKRFFPRYDAVLLARSDFARRRPKLWAAARRALEGRLSERQMARLNAEADLEKRDFGAIAAGFLGRAVPHREEDGLAGGLLRRTKEHLLLLAISLAASLAVGLPLGVLAARRRRLGKVILGASGVLQTVPSLALLCFLIPLCGIGAVPALVALFLYGLLPIVLNTCNGLASLDPRLIESAKALGLSEAQRLRHVELPLASVSILGGIRTSAIVGVGTATLAALIGAGGYGVPIVAGLALNDTRMILTGAIPAALLALALHALFDLLEWAVVPQALRHDMALTNE